MTSNDDAIKIREYFHHAIIEKIALIPHEATDIRICNLSKIGGSLNIVYSFSLVYSYKSKDVRLALVLKLYEQKEQHICQKEYQIMKDLKNVNFPVPQVYVMETNARFLGGPFIIMERVEGKRMLNLLKHLSEKEIYDVIRCFAKTLVLLHELKLEDIGSNVLIMPKDEYAYARKSALYKDELDFAKKWDYGWVTNWLKINAEKCPCNQYSLVHRDVNLNNFIITKEGKIFFVDWACVETGDALRDVGGVYHEIRHTLGTKAASFFLKHYIKSSKRKIDYSNLRFYIVSSGLELALFFRYLCTKKLGTGCLIKLFGTKYLPFPLIRWYFTRRRMRLENYLRSEVLDYEKAMFGTPGGKILSSMEMEDVLKLLNAVPSDLILDVGTGSGRIAREIISKTKARVIGFDVRRTAIMSAKNNRGNIDSYELVVAEGQHMPFSDCSFDAVICIRTLKYMPDYILGISEMTRVLKPDKRLILDLSSVLDSPIRSFLDRYVTHSLGALRHHIFNFYKMKNLLKREKLSIVKSLPSQKIPHNVWNLSNNSTVLQLLVVTEKILKKITPLIFSRSILLKCVNVNQPEPTNG